MKPSANTASTGGHHARRSPIQGIERYAHGWIEKLKDDALSNIFQTSPLHTLDSGTKHYADVAACFSRSRHGAPWQRCVVEGTWLKILRYQWNHRSTPARKTNLQASAASTPRKLAISKNAQSVIIDSLLKGLRSFLTDVQLLSATGLAQTRIECLTTTDNL